MLSIVILAAGCGRRMRSKMQKVLHPLGGKPMLARVVDTALKLAPEDICVVIGAGGDEVKTRLEHLPVKWIEQKERLGSGHAVLQAIPKIASDHQVIVLYGDVPLISSEILTTLLAETTAANLGVVVTELDDPTGFGRIIRNEHGHITAIVEQRDADEHQREIKEINTGILLATAENLHKWLPKLDNNNAQGEYYLTDIIAMAVADGIPVIDVVAPHHEEVLGSNDLAELARLERYYQLQQATRLMKQGVAIRDPQRFDLRGECDVGQDSVIDVNVVIEGKVTIGNECTIGPNTVLRNATIGDHVQVLENCVIDGAVIENHCIVGPFAHLRPGTHLKAEAKVGNFVEVKNTTIGEQSKANHLSYLGDAQIGKDVNIGAGVITVNYDGANKHQTTIKDHAFIGCDTQLIAPVSVEKNAFIGAGSTISKTAPENALTLSRSKQTTITNWQRPKKSEGKSETCKATTE